MAQAAWRMQAEVDSDIVRRLVVRPLRVVAQPGVAPPSAEVIALVPPTEDEDAPFADLLCLKTEVTLMKAILAAERTENARLRAQIEKVEAIVAVVEDADLTHGQWAGLVDQLLHVRR